MTNRQLIEMAKLFAGNNRGETPIRTTMWLGAVGLGLAVLVAPLLDSASRKYAENKSFGIDRVLTGSIGNSKRYTVRKSVLQPGETRICEDRNSEDC